ncbi:type VI secretion system Vgr family protein [Caldimonas thermodepolymerans]|uniref:Type VI secretion system secreted protein VgrG n=1 Tax=Caldimonas thermodepolymerans TaxID=215580 RepID=A0AA46HXD5_9BURK|nr:type VI secretion system tip protein VgrG [Caldimonas thermodepolymerans]TCP09785.1 type VI secretion system secreted protein VgrG [Caldimonas thermodepolymerans]UZG49794.1 type VI secretion system tip protein TssI/VgrG [Caldimonas thermodepolymerans]
MARVMEIDTPLGPDVLLFRAMSAREELGRPFEFLIEVLSDKGELPVHELLGKPVTVRLELPEERARFFNGIVARMATASPLGRYHRYRLTVRPWLWLLTRNSNCRIFQQQSVPDILSQVFAKYPQAAIEKRLTGSYRTWEYCVQYRETDFNFVSRLMEQEGIYYYFRHEPGRHTLVLADGLSAHEAVPGFKSVPYIPHDRGRRLEQEYIDEWSVSAEIQPGSYVLDDFDFTKPSAELRASARRSRPHDAADGEYYDYPGEYEARSDGELYAKLRLEELQAHHEQIQGSGNARGLAVGALFRLTGHTRGDQNREYLVRSTHIEMQFGEYESLDAGSTDYHIRFAVQPSQEAFRTERLTPKPVVQGPQTAIVVGPAGDEIHTDKYGRVKVQFHWDRDGAGDENSSCWVRVAQPWAGKNFGMIAIPRIGQEVVVDFLEGDPDRPLVTGRVYNGEQMPPWELPANKTQTGILTRSTPDGSAANANAIRFEDKKGEEQLWIHAEKNQDIEVENDETHWVGHDRKKTIDHDETVEVKNNRTETVGNDEQITIGANRTEKVGGDESITVGGNRSETVGASEDVIVSANRSHMVGSNDDLKVGANRTINVGANQQLVVGGNVTEAVGGSCTQTIGGALTQTVAGPVTINTPAAMTITAAGGVTIVAPGGTKVIDNFLSNLGGMLTQSYGQIMKFTPMSMEVKAVSVEGCGVKVDMGTVHTHKTGVHVQQLGAKLLSTDSAFLNKAGLMLAKAGIHLIG